MVDKILDTAGQKGTGKWTGIGALESRHARNVDRRGGFRAVHFRDQGGACRRGEGSRWVQRRSAAEDRKEFIEDVRRALYCSKMITYAQGYMLLREAAKEQKWNLNYGGIALMWRGGCIIRSRFLGKIKEAFDKNPNLNNLLLDDFFSGVVNNYQGLWRQALVQAISMACRRRRFRRRSRFSTGIARRGCRRIYCRRSGIISARILMSGSISRGGSSSTRTGLGAGGGFRRRRITFNL